MPALAAFKCTHDQLAQVFRSLVKRWGCGLDNLYGFGTGSHSIVPYFVGQGGQKIGGELKLRRLRVGPTLVRPGENASLPPLGNKLVKQDEHPAQPKQRQISAEPICKGAILSV